MNLETTDTVVMSDLHGQVDKLEQIYNRYGDNVRYIINGDIVDGNNTKPTLDLVKQIGALMTVGNHEWWLRAVLEEPDPEVKLSLLDFWKPRDPNRRGIEQSTLLSYGINDRQPAWEAAIELQQKMRAAGHIALLEQAQLYFEDEDFIVVHAGLTNDSWEMQKQVLDDAKHKLDIYNFSTAPTQIFDEIKVSGKRAGYVWSAGPEASNATRKTLVTGHAHLTISAEDRVTALGKRVRLASHVRQQEPAFVWQNWDNQVKAI